MLSTINEIINVIFKKKTIYYSNFIFKKKNGITSYSFTSKPISHWLYYVDGIDQFVRVDYMHLLLYSILMLRELSNSRISLYK
jgi:hypothetical protein